MPSETVPSVVNLPKLKSVFLRLFPVNIYFRKSRNRSFQIFFLAKHFQPDDVTWYKSLNFIGLAANGFLSPEYFHQFQKQNKFEPMRTEGE